MTAREGMSEIDQMVLLSLVRLGDSAYGVTIRSEIQERSKRPVSMAAVYSALDRLERKGLAVSRLSDPKPERGGRAKKYFKITPEGAAELREAKSSMDRMWEGLDVHPDLSVR